MEKIIDDENRIEFDIQKFLNEDCTEENEMGIKVTFGILEKAWAKGVEVGFNHGWNRGYDSGNKNSIELTQKICDKATDRILNAESISYDTGFKKAIMMIEWYNKIFLGIDTEYNPEKIKRTYMKYKGE